jgi:hypothetical protein
VICTWASAHEDVEGKTAGVEQNIAPYTPNISNYLHFGGLSVPFSVFTSTVTSWCSKKDMGLGTQSSGIWAFHFIVSNSVREIRWGLSPLICK